MNMHNVEDIYPLTPTQHGMLFHTLYAPHSGIYCVQAGITFHMPLDTETLKRAWQLAVARHSILRTAFLWEGLDQPLQVVHQQVDIPWEVQNWQDISSAEHTHLIEKLLHAERRRGFVLSQAPLFRLILLRLAPTTHHFILSYHHLLLDGWSLVLLLDEVLAFYKELLQGSPPLLSKPDPYRDYVAWLLQQDQAAAERFWRSHLAVFTSATPLVVDHLRTETPLPRDEESAEQEIYLSQETTTKLHELARRYHLTVNTILQGAWALLLSRYSGNSDVVYGATISTRPHTLSGVESMIGLFINTLPVRIHISENMQVIDWLKQVQAEQIEARQHDYAPLVQIQSWSEVTRGQPLFESLLVFENYPAQMAADTAMQDFAPARDLWWGMERATYPLTLTVGVRAQIMLRAGYERNRFAEETITRLLGHISTLLESIVSSTELPVKALQLLTKAERIQLLTEWNSGTLFASDKQLCLHQLFEIQAERLPDAIALSWGEVQITYAELNACANQIAHNLLRRGVGPEVLVGLYMERSVEMIVATLGILKAGGAYVPLDPLYPVERLRFMITYAHPHLILTQNSLFPMLPGNGMTRALCLDDEWGQIAQEECSNLPTLISPANAAYVIYTSGSTGQPKGVVVTHTGLGNLATVQQTAFNISGISRVLQFASWSFDAAVSEWAMALLAGATLCLAAQEELRPGPALQDLLHEQAITTVTLPPSALTVLPEPSRNRWLSLQTMVVAGEACSRELVAPWLEHCRVINAYGPTETSVCATMAECTPERIKPPIGRPIPQTQIYVLDTQMELVAPGIVGELYIGGTGLARGYLGRPDLTAERFLPHPFSQQPGACLYRTGDLVRYLPDGNLEFVGRRDTQVKLRGYRIEIGEIENTLRQHPEVREAVVILLEDATTYQQLVAYIVPTREGVRSDLNASDLRQFLQTWLPEYMLPSTFVALERLPLMPNGKIDRQALPAPDISRLDVATPFEPPSNTVEEALADIWAEVLELEQVGRHDNFFELGGHSLLATQVFSRMQETFQVELPLQTLFESPTIALLAEAIIASTLEEADSDVIAQLLENPEE